MSISSFAENAARPAAAVAASIFVVVAGFEEFWALGGTWGLSGGWGGAHNVLPPGLRIASALASVFLIVAALVVLGRAGYWRAAFPFGVMRWGTWTIVVVVALSALANFASSSSWERWQNGPVGLLLAFLCLIVARGANAR
jgi:hypothetical protein